MAILILLVVGGLIAATVAAVRESQEQQRARQVEHWMERDRAQDPSPHSMFGALPQSNPHDPRASG
jgi:type II secretory pathway pseudopilin PulG